MKRLILTAMALVMLPASTPAQDLEMAEKARSIPPIVMAAVLDSTAPRFSRDNPSTWLKAWSDSGTNPKGLEAIPSQTQTKEIRKRRKWPYLAGGLGALFVGYGLTVTYQPCYSNRDFTVTCSPWTSGWVRGGGIALIVGGGGMIAYGATR